MQRHKPTGELHPSATLASRWSVISVDFISELPLAKSNHNAIMNIVDVASKRAHFILTYNTVTAEDSAHLFLRHVWKLHGLPDAVISNRGPQFIADFTRELYKLLGIKRSTSTTYHPQSDSQTEHVNQEMEQFLRVFINKQQNDWEELLPLAEFTYNNHSHSSTQDTPFMLDTGHHPWMGSEPRQRASEIEAVNDIRNHMETGLEEAKAALVKAKAEYSHYYDCQRTPAPTLNLGDRVWLDASDIKTMRLVLLRLRLRAG
jgi:hypothetical protein